MEKIKVVIEKFYPQNHNESESWGLYNEVGQCIENDFDTEDDAILYAYYNGLEIVELFNTQKNIMEYNENEIDMIALEQGWAITYCKDEKDGKDCPGVNTIEVAKDVDYENFGAFTSNPKTGKFTFKFYL